MKDLATVAVMSLWTSATLFAVAMVAYAVRLARVADDRLRAKEGKAASRDRATKALGIGRAAMVVAAAFQLIGVVTRGIEAGHAPWSNMYEYTITAVLVGAAVFLWLQRTRDMAFVAPAVAFFSVFATVTALHVFYRDAVGLMVALDSYWLVIHVPIAVIASGIFGVSGVLSLAQIAKARRAATSVGKAADADAAAAGTASGADAASGAEAQPVGRIGRLLAAVPSPTALDSLAFRLNSVGFILWTFTVVSGALWAEDAWGRYWGWDPKEVWSFVIWVLYAAYLHARTTQGWMGKRAAWLAVAGFTAIILNFTVVNTLLQGKHSYSGL